MQNLKKLSSKNTLSLLCMSIVFIGCSQKEIITKKEDPYKRAYHSQNLSDKAHNKLDKEMNKFEQ